MFRFSKYLHNFILMSILLFINIFKTSSQKYVNTHKIQNVLFLVHVTCDDFSWLFSTEFLNVISIFKETVICATDYLNCLHLLIIFLKFLLFPFFCFLGLIDFLQKQMYFAISAWSFLFMSVSPRHNEICILMGYLLAFLSLT